MDWDTLTKDAILGGKIHILQEKSGYRFSLDAVLLPNFTDCSPNSMVADLGTGAGVIPLILASLHPTARIFGVEIQESLAALALRNVQENNLEKQITIIQHDFKTLPIPGLPSKVDRVLSNPPYRRLGSGKVNPQSQKAVARHEIMANLQDVAQTAARLLGKGGHFAAVYPATRLADLIYALKENYLEPKRLRMVHSDTASPARLVLVEAIKDAGPQITVERPLYIYEDGETYTEEVRAMLYPL
ncbi:MAG: tRNA1(Val) (adenine(37)-N6)-methyltransferase [Desulfatibacillum sp.]|nr:tRNA1(Val) (adenine(37)-N6)-methyltransferase [Desulfatibacillum sp.]